VFFNADKVNEIKKIGFPRLIIVENGRRGILPMDRKTGFEQRKVKIFVKFMLI